ncbi:hypothetical protein F53441_7199 [Fusarium austroafricanum]|uniref:DUF7924 domain-containing protein n=1 Tax=Fusarium austroafricanum TaxID=2364996 RepID=A0A8H4KG55_9HYPO|nr:hypothetical protein F53441_7199 [Fusarium austroafricanum]
MVQTRAQVRASLNQQHQQQLTTNSEDTKKKGNTEKKAPQKASQHQLGPANQKALRSIETIDASLPSPVRQSFEPQSAHRQLEDEGSSAPDQPNNRGYIQQAISEDELDNDDDPVTYWARTGHWPLNRATDKPKMTLIYAKKKPSRSDNKRAASPISVQTSSETKSASYEKDAYEDRLNEKGSFMKDAESGIAPESDAVISDLLSSDQIVPQNTLFQDHIFEKTYEMVRSRNEVRVTRDITPLIVPSAETLAIHGADNLECLIESTNEPWSNSFPFTATQPKPDYSVGFTRSAFTDDQLKKLFPFIGNTLVGDQSYLMATYRMYFPFLTCEAKCSSGCLETADRQNAHSMTLAVRGVFELFDHVGREKEVDRQILAFSISHNHRYVRIYGHYPVIQGGKVKYYRHLIRGFDFISNSEEKWTAYRFTMNVYHRWMPSHLKRICSAVDELPLLSNVDLATIPEEPPQQPSMASTMDTTMDTTMDSTPGTSSTKPRRASKRQRKDA